MIIPFKKKSVFEPVNDQNVHKAVLLSCIAMDLPGARYFKKEGKLVIAYNWDSDMDGPLADIPGLQDGMQALMTNLPSEYGAKVDIWDNEHKRQVPGEILDKTGYVSLYHEGYNVF